MCREGSMVLPGLSPGVKESRAAWAEFRYGLIRRDLREPVRVVTDGRPALIALVVRVIPYAKGFHITKREIQQQQALRKEKALSLQPSPNDEFFVETFT